MDFTNENNDPSSSSGDVISDCLKTIVDNEPEISRNNLDLFMVHSTREGSLLGDGKIIHRGHIQSQRVRYGKKPVVCMYYGKPNYNPLGKELDLLIENRPVCLLFSLNDLSNQEELLNIFPFDSGGYRRYGISKNYSVQDFMYNSPCPKTVKRFIRLFFRNDSFYLKSRIAKKKLQRLCDRCGLLMEILKMYNKRKRLSRGYNKTIKYGYQAYCIEFQYLNDVAFTPTHIILPADYGTNKKWEKQVAEYKEKNKSVQIITYGESMINKLGNQLNGRNFLDAMQTEVYNLYPSNPPSKVK